MLHNVFNTSVTHGLCMLQISSIQCFNARARIYSLCSWSILNPVLALPSAEVGNVTSSTPPRARRLPHASHLTASSHSLLTPTYPSCSAEMLAPYIALWLETTFVVICALSFCMFSVCTASPRLMVRLNSVPWAFQPARNLDVEYQAVLYAALHTGCFNRLAHMTLSVDPTLWFALLYTWRPELFYALLGLLVAQASLLPSGVLGALMLLLWGASAALGIALTEWWLPSSADARHLSMTILLLNSVLRFIGHLQKSRCRRACHRRLPHSTSRTISSTFAARLSSAKTRGRASFFCCRLSASSPSLPRGCPSASP